MTHTAKVNPTMRVAFSQIYIEADANFPFSLRFQQRLEEEMLGLVQASDHFKQKYGDDWTLIFRISAKKTLTQNEIKGPCLYKREKDIEFTVFLPYDVIAAQQEIYRSAIQFLLDGVISVLRIVKIDPTKVEDRRQFIIESIWSDPAMFKATR